MRRWMSIPALFSVLAAGTLTAAVTTASGSPAAPAAAAKPAITKVVFTGTTKAPVITITGTNFGKAPAHDPAWRPAKHKVCTSKTPTGDLSRFGWDYANELFINDKTQKPNWTAGRYSVKPAVVDCIGLIVTTYTSTSVVFHLGAAYPNYPGASARYKLATGDIFQIGLKGARYVATVKYKKAAPVKKK